MDEPLQTTQVLFNDFDFYAESVKQADIEHAQLSVGSFQGEMSQLGIGPVILSHHRMNQTILQRGIGLKSYTTFLIPGNMDQEFIWRKNTLRGNVIGILKDGMEHDTITRSNFVGTAVSIKNSYLRSLSMKLGYYNFFDFLVPVESISIRTCLARQLQDLIALCCLNPPKNSLVILEDIPRLIIQALSQSDMKSGIYDVGSRNRIFKQSQDIIHNSVHSPISVIKLSDKLGVSERTLRYAFVAQAGMSPKKYMLYYRLNQVRKAIKNKKYKKIADAAQDFGYWHSGQFAADYKQLFGELPSET